MTNLLQSEPRGTTQLMQGKRAIRYIRDAFRGRVYQSLAILFCVLFGVAMIANTQMSGEAEWFWYAKLLHNGAKLYADLHLPLQPQFVLETNAWIQLFGIKCLVTEIPSVIHVFAYCLGIFLILRESDWPDWQKSIILASAFLICVECTAYRFDDFHTLAELFIFYSLLLLLMVPKTDSTQRLFGLASVLGLLSGLAITTRLTDGAALLVSTGVCVLILARKKKLAVASLFVVVAMLTVVLVVKVTGDSLIDYASNSIIKAAGAKGGTNKILGAPFLMFRNALQLFPGRRWILLWLIALAAGGAVVQRYWKSGVRYIVVVQFGIAMIACVCSPKLRRADTFFFFFTIFSIVVNYLLFPLVIVRYFASKMGYDKGEWDPREVLILLPLAELASASASTAATTTSVFLAPIAILLLLIPVIHPFRRHANWANASLVTIMALLGLSVMRGKIHNPYSWNSFSSSPMFVNRQWYQHPVYGPMYIDRDLLRFIEPICQQIEKKNTRTELLSIPFSYPNYFCNIPPWHGYVQTFFDTTTRPTIDHLLNEIKTAPPQWIVYQRQMKILSGAEFFYNHGKPLAHRDLDEMIMRKIATGQWQVVEKSNYLLLDRKNYQDGDGWLIIRTRP